VGAIADLAEFTVTVQYELKVQVAIPVSELPTYDQ